MNDKILAQIHRLDGELFQIKAELRLPLSSKDRRHLYKRLVRATRSILVFGEMLEREKAEV